MLPGLFLWLPWTDSLGLESAPKWSAAKKDQKPGGFKQQKCIPSRSLWFKTNSKAWVEPCSLWGAQGETAVSWSLRSWPPSSVFGAPSVACGHIAPVSSSPHVLSHPCLLFLQRHQSGRFSPTLISHIMPTWSHLQRSYFQIWAHSQVPEIRQSVMWWTHKPPARHWLVSDGTAAAALWLRWPLLQGVGKASSWTVCLPIPMPCLRMLPPSTHVLLAWASARSHIGSAPAVTPKVRRSSKSLCFRDCKFKLFFFVICCNI